MAIAALGAIAPSQGYQRGAMVTTAAETFQPSRSASNKEHLYLFIQIFGCIFTGSRGEGRRC